MEEEGTERTELVLDWEKLLPSDDDHDDHSAVEAVGNGLRSAA